MRLVRTSIVAFALMGTSVSAQQTAPLSNTIPVTLAPAVAGPESGRVIVFAKRVEPGDKPVIEPAVRMLIDLGFHIVATDGTADYLAEHGLPVERVNKVMQGRPHIVDRLKDGGVQLVLNTTEGWQSLQDSKSIRASAMLARIPYFTTAAAGVAAVRAIAALREHSLEVRSLQSYHS